MKHILKFSLVSGFIVASFSSVFADEQINCDPGQKKAAFSDGNTVTEVCVDSSEMDQTVVNPEVPVGEDPSNTDGHTEG